MCPGSLHEGSYILSTASTFYTSNNNRCAKPIVYSDKIYYQWQCRWEVFGIFQLKKVNAESISDVIATEGKNLFLAKLDKIPTFFSKSPEIRRVVELNVPSGWKTRWNYNSKTVCKVAERKIELLKGFGYFVSNTDCYGFSTIAAAENCIRLLNDEKFSYWLNFF